MLTILVDADACPVKDEIYRVARRYALRVVVVSNTALCVPRDPLIELIVLMDASFNGVDDWIAERAGVGDIVVTADIPLASRCLARQARVLGPRGRPFTENDIGSSLAMRELLGALRQSGKVSGGPAPMSPKDRSRFLCQLDEIINAIRRTCPAAL
jgi:uncharacterized protein YaiI (UPF0178 family)